MSVKRFGRKKNANEEKLRKKRSARKRKRNGSNAKSSGKKTMKNGLGSASVMKNGVQNNELWMSNEKKSGRNDTSDDDVRTAIGIGIGDIVSEIAVAQETETWIEIVTGTETGIGTEIIIVTATALPATAPIVVYRLVSKTPEMRKLQYQRNLLPRQPRLRLWMRRLWKRLPCNSC